MHIFCTHLKQICINKNPAVFISNIRNEYVITECSEIRTKRQVYKTIAQLSVFARFSRACRHQQVELTMVSAVIFSSALTDDIEGFVQRRRQDFVFEGPSERAKHGVGLGAEPLVMRL